MKTYSLNCKSFKEKFNSIDTLLDYIKDSGADPNYEITENGVGINETAWDYLEEAW